MGVKSIKTSLSKNKNQCSNHQIFKQIFTGYAGPKLTDGGVRKKQTLCLYNRVPAKTLSMYFATNVIYGPSAGCNT